MWQRIQYVGWNLLHIRILAQYQGMHCLFLRCCASSKFLQWLQTISLKVCYWVRNVCYRIEILRQWRSRLVSNYQLNAQFLYSITIYRVSQEELTKLREGVPYVKLYRYNPKHLYPQLNGYGDNGKRSLKLWQLLHTYWLPNSYWNWQEYVVSLMLISALNIKITCEWHKAIKLNYKNTRTHITVVLKVTKHCTYRQ